LFSATYPSDDDKDGEAKMEKIVTDAYQIKLTAESSMQRLSTIQ